MFSINRYRCARRLCVAKITILLACAIALAGASPAKAGSMGSSVSLQVIDQAGPIWVDYEFAGTDTFGLPSLEIYEKFQSTDEEVLWADVEVKVTVHHPTHSDDGGNLFEDIWNDIFDDIFGGWGWGHGNDDEPEDPIDPNYRPESLVVGIDKFVKNKTDLHWDNFLIQLGTGVGDDPNDDPFMNSTQNDGLYFVHDPMPKEVTDFYGPLQPNGNPTPDNLFWSADQGPGQGYHDRATFWFGVHVPSEFFEQDHQDPDYWHARFTIRQHVNIPEPTTIAMAVLGLSVALLSRAKPGA